MVSLVRPKFLVLGVILDQDSQSSVKVLQDGHAVDKISEQIGMALVFSQDPIEQGVGLLLSIRKLPVRREQVEVTTKRVCLRVNWGINLPFASKTIKFSTIYESDVTFFSAYSNRSLKAASLLRPLRAVRKPVPFAPGSIKSDGASSIRAFSILYLPARRY